ncbi:MAG: hypothetical protein AB1486_02395 [Planctomycetota bacterium]
MTPADPVRSLVTRVLARAGALLDQSDEAVEAIVPAALAATLGIPEHATLYFRRARQKDAGAVLAGLGSEFIERLCAGLHERGLATARSISKLYLKSDRLDEALARKLTFGNAKVVVGQSYPERASYLILHVRYSVVSESRREGILALALNECTLGEVPDLVGHAALGDAATGSLAEPAARQPWGAVLERAQLILERRLQDELEPFRVLLERRRARDRQRVIEYFADLASEHVTYARRGTVPGEGDAGAQDKVAACVAARDAKLAELAERYAMKVAVRAVAACRVLLPVTSISVKLHRGRDVRRCVFHWNPLLKEVEGATCEACGVATRLLFLGKAMQLVCRECRARGTSQPRPTNQEG